MTALFDTTSHTLVSADWAACLASATREDDVINAANEYVASWTQAELARLPSECRPPVFHTPQQISNYAFVLTRAELAGNLANDRMLAFFSHASQRVAIIAHVRGAPAR